MRLRRLAFACAGLLAAHVAFAASPVPWSMETDKEWFVTGDFNGDGLLDVVVVDRASGQYRTGWQKEPDNVGWSPSRPSGMNDIEGATAGRLLDANFDSVALASPYANRLHILTPDAEKLVLPTAVYPQGFGANQVVALDILGEGVAGFDDLLVASRLNSPPLVGRLESRSNGGGTFSYISVDESSENRITSSQRAELRAGDPAVFVGMHRSGSDDGLTALDYSSGGALNAIPGIGGMSPGTRVLAARFADRFLATVLFFESGANVAQVFGLTENGPMDYLAGKLFDLPLPAPIGSLAALPDPSGNRLLFISADGSQFIVYKFTEEPDPEKLHQVEAGENGLFTGILPLGDGHFMMLSGPDGRSAHFQTWLQNGDSYEAGPEGVLPAVDPHGGRATILEFRDEPLVASQPGMTRSVAVGDWSATAVLAGGPLELSSSVEQFVGTIGGLDNPTPTTIGEAHPATVFALPNQYRSDISFFQLFNARGDEVATITANPPGGAYPQSLQVTLSAVPDSTIVGYRLGEADSWKAFNSPINIFTNTTLQFFGLTLSGEKSPIRTETYTFDFGPEELDSDGDGVLDYVEIAEGLDPVESGNDGDGDGFFDRDELVTGTGVLDNGDFPASGHQRLDDLNLIDLRIAPEPYDGTQPARTTTTLGANIRAYDGTGIILGASVTKVLNLPGLTDPAASVSFGVRQELTWITAVTDQHFDLVTPDPEPARGRELFRIIPMPENAALPVVAYAYDHSLSVEDNAAAWIAEVQATYAARAPVEIDHTLREDDVLIALLMERRLADIFLNRGEEWATNFTIFPQRSADVGRRAPTTAELASLRHRASPVLPGYQLQDVFEHFELVVKSGVGPNLDQLRLLIRDIYRISSALHNDNPGDYPSPVAVIRAFLVDGSVDANYAAETTVAPGNQTSAFVAVQNLLNNAPTRPYQTLQLVVLPDSFTGACTLLDTPGGLQTWALFHDGAIPYGGLETFDLIAGVRLEVSGYTDMDSAECGPNGIEVDTIGLQLVPAASTYDLDGNMLVDSWEQVFFGGPVNPFDDDDLDFFTNLQEMFEGSDPNDALGQPGVAVEPLAPPLLQIEVLPNDDIHLTWDWPFAYANQIQVQMLSKPTLTDSFDVTPLIPIHIGGDQFEVVIADPGAAAYFFQFVLLLKAE